MADLSPTYTLVLAPDKGEPILAEDDVFVLHELTDAWLRVEALPDVELLPVAFLDARELTWDGRERGFRLDHNIIAQWVGRCELTVEVGDFRATVWLDVQPRPAKASKAAWLAMVRQLEGWLAGVTVGAEGGRHGEVSLRGSDVRLAAEALSALVPEFARAFAEILHDPCTHDRARAEIVPMRAARRVRPSSMSWLVRNPDVAQRFRVLEVPGSQPRVIDLVAHPDLAHAANRYIAWFLPEVIARLTAIHRELDRLAAHREMRNSLNHTSQWLRARADRLRADIDRIHALWSRSRLRALMPSRSLEPAVSVLLGHPAYARVHELGCLFLSPRFAMPDVGERDVPMASVRPSFDLYELWAFLYVYRSLAACLPGWTFTPYNLDRLLEVTETGSGAYIEGRPDNNTSGQALKIFYNEEFPRVTQAYKRADAPSHYSLSSKRRPDIVVAHSGPEHGGRWVCLDAKYYDPKNLDEPMDKLHIYRDALWMEPYGGRACAGLLLVPACKQAPWTSPAYRDRFGIGAWICEPGARPDPALGSWILSRLFRVTDGAKAAR